MKKLPLWHYPLWFCGSVVLALALLLLCACLPQGPIDRHVADSSVALSLEGTYPTVFDYATSAQLDNYTDAIILDVSRGTRIAQASTILTNPIHRYHEDPVKALALYSEKEADAAPSFYYPRYWMGFRVLTRLALVFLNYLQIRRYLAFLLLTLALGTVLSVARHADGRAALAFGLSFLLVRPQVICQSLQFSCCFFLAMLAMLLVPWLRRHRDYEGLFFLELGVAVMFFDFYTTPLLVFGWPMVYLWLLDAREGQPLSWKRGLLNLALWFGGYVLMWLAKLALTTLLTSENALETGLGAMAARVGFVKAAGDERSYSASLALWKLRNTITVDAAGAVIWLLGTLCVLVLLAHALLRRRTAPTVLWRYALLLVLAALPFVWFMIAAQPTVHHTWFQYRSIGLSYWALGAWLCLCLQPPAPQEST